MDLPLPRTISVLPVVGHSVPRKEPDGTLVVGKFIGYGADGQPKTAPVGVPDTLYYREQIQAGALREYVPPVEAAPTPEVAVVAPAVPLAGLTLEDATAAATAPLIVSADTPTEPAPVDSAAKSPARRRATP